MQILCSLMGASGKAQFTPRVTAVEAPGTSGVQLSAAFAPHPALAAVRRMVNKRPLGYWRQHLHLTQLVVRNTGAFALGSACGALHGPPLTGSCKRAHARSGLLPHLPPPVRRKLPIRAAPSQP